MSELENKMKSLLNHYSAENESNTPDFVLARFIFESLDAFNKAVRTRENYYGRTDTASHKAMEPALTKKCDVCGGTGTIEDNEYCGVVKMQCYICKGTGVHQ